VNISETDWKDIKRILGESLTNDIRQTNTQSQQGDILNTQLPGMNQTLGELLVMLRETKDKQETSTTVFWILGFFIVVVITIIYSFYHYRKVNRKEIYTDGGMKYRT
jgi:NADH:ubiquinone oxidoreductase subunit 4 (subunit M)